MVRTYLDTIEMTFKVEQIRAKAKVNQVNVNWKLQQSNSQKWQDQSNFDPEACWVEKTLNIVKSMYRTRAIITCSLYTFYPPFQVNLCTVVFGLMYGKYSIAGSNQEQVIVARVRYSKNSQKKFPNNCQKLWNKIKKKLGESVKLII